MSVIQLLVLDEAKRPELETIREEAQAEAKPYLPHGADLASHTGFLPVKIGEQDTGFEYYFDAISAEQLPEEATRFGSHQMIARTGGDFLEMLASLLFFRTVAKLSGAAYVYPDDGIIVPPTEVEAYLTEQIALVGEYI